MIKPEILEMVEECKNIAVCECEDICSSKKLCNRFRNYFIGNPEGYNKSILENILSFLTSQEVCECEDMKEFDGTMIANDLFYNYDNVKYCPFCGNFIKKGE